MTAVTAPKRDDLAGFHRQSAEILAGPRTRRRATWRESKHVGGLAARPEEYEHRVIAFFDHALQGEQP